MNKTPNSGFYFHLFEIYVSVLFLLPLTPFQRLCVVLLTYLLEVRKYRVLDISFLLIVFCKGVIYFVVWLPTSFFYSLSFKAVIVMFFSVGGKVKVRTSEFLLLVMFGSVFRMPYLRERNKGLPPFYFILKISWAVNLFKQLLQKQTTLLTQLPLNKSFWMCFMFLKFFLD